MPIRRLDPSWLDTVWREVRHAARALGRSPAVTATAVLSLALGIGATTTIFSVVHAVVIDPFPYRSPDTLVSLAVVGPDGRGNGSTYTTDEYVELAERATAFDGVIASTISDVSLTEAGVPQRLRGNYALDSQQPVTDVRALDAVIDDEVFARPRLRLMALGTLAGLLLALWATRVLSAQVWGVSTRDPLEYVVVAIVLGAAGLLASLPPALRAARSSPLAALRAD